MYVCMYVYIYIYIYIYLYIYVMVSVSFPIGRLLVYMRSFKYNHPMRQRVDNNHITLSIQLSDLWLTLLHDRAHMCRVHTDRRKNQQSHESREPASTTTS